MDKGFDLSFDIDEALGMGLPGLDAGNQGARKWRCEREFPPSQDELEGLFEIMRLARVAADRLAQGSLPYKEIIWMRVLNGMVARENQRD